MFDWNNIKRDEHGKIILLYRHQRMFDEGIFDKPSYFLDVGGWGILAARLIEEGHTGYILDNFSEDQYFPERVKTLPHIEADITDYLSFIGYGKFDVITCFEMLEHCHNQPQAVVNMYRALRYGGILVGTFPIPGRVHKLGEEGVRFLNEKELRSLLEGSGFIDVSIEPTGSVSRYEEPCSLYFKGIK